MEAVRGKESFDRPLFITIIVLLLLGTVIVLDASCARAFQSRALGNDPFYFFRKQAQWAVIAGLVLAFAMHLPYWKLRQFCLVGFVATVLLLVLVLIPGVGIKISGARRWLGFGAMNFQPSELAKLSLVFFMARYSELWRGHITDFRRGFLPAAGALYLVVGLVAKEDLGTGITLLVTGVVMLFLMGSRASHMAGLLTVTLLAGSLLVVTDAERTERVTTWVTLLRHMVAVYDGPAYQPAQGLIALGSGGISGQGVMRGYAKHLYLPAEHTDYIFATVGEETGLLGCLALVLAFTVLIIRGLTIAHRTRDWFGSLVAAGMTTLVGAQALLNIAVVTGLVPCTGVPLPFISYGGSSVVFTALAVGVLLNISQYPNRGAAGHAVGKARQVRESRADGWRNRRPHLSRT